jgi:hypothetical protein
MIKFRVWWIPQVPGQSFDIHDVRDLDTAILLCNVLANYDLFQYENKIKPDYCNVGGIQWHHPCFELDDEWEDFDYEDEEEIGRIREMITDWEKENECSSS